MTNRRDLLKLILGAPAALLLGRRAEPESPLWGSVWITNMEGTQMRLLGIVAVSPIAVSYSTLKVGYDA